MRFSLISLTALGVVAIGFYALKSEAPAELGEIVGSITPAAAPEMPKAPRLRSAREHSGKTERIVAQFSMPDETPDAGQRSVPLVISRDPAGNEQHAPVKQAAPEAKKAQKSAPAVDESALRYFAARGDTARLQAEISRLMTLYPGWMPPADPLATPPATDEQLDTMWRLYAESRFEAVREAIADRQAAESDWQPPADLLDRLKLAEARASLVTASDAMNHDAVIRTAAENPSLLTCSEVDMLWRVAKAFALTGKTGRARDAYAYILDNCDNASERYATVQKASELLSVDLLDDLLSRERSAPGGKPEFEPLRDDLARRLVGGGDEDPTLVVPEKYVTRLERLAESGGLASDALLLGWYHYRRDDLGAAERWFRKAFDKDETASAAEGLALTLIAHNAPVEAEAILYRWRQSSSGAMLAYLAAVTNSLAPDPPPILADEVLRRMAPVVLAERHVDAAQQFGWYARYMCQLQTASEWFETALSWNADDEPSAYGLALTRKDLGDEGGVAEIQRIWAGRSQRIAQLYEPVRENEELRRSCAAADIGPVASQVASRSSEPRTVDTQPARPVAVVREPAPPARKTQPRRSADVPVRSSSHRRGECWTGADPRRMSPDAALARGWCLLDIDRPLEAARFFDAASASSSAAARSDAAYGKSLAYLRAGLTNKASVAAADASQTNKRAVELQASILAERATNAFKLGRYREALVALDQRAQIAPEQVDLMALRGYAHLKLGRRADAQRIFQALADIGDKAGLRGLAEILDE